MKKSEIKIYRTLILLVLLFSTVQSAFSQTETVKIIGTVYNNELKKPLPGVSIKVVGKEEEVVSDEEGKFEIQGDGANVTILTFKLEGFERKEFQVKKANNTVTIHLKPITNILNEIIVSSRRRNEIIQNVPIPISVVKGALIEESGSFNVNRVKELVPSVQLYSSNARNTTLNIRGLGSTYGLTNDGIDTGVGFYVDGVYYSRPGATSLDFIDIERIEVLRGPQGTLFGKNTTAGAFNITTRKPSFIPSAQAEVSYGNYGFVQAKSSINGEIFKNIAGRLSFSGTQRDGVVENVKTGKKINDINNLGFKGQLLYTPNEKTEVLLSADYSRQRPDGSAQVVAGVVTTKRATYRQFDQIIADLGYQLPSRNAFDRKVDTDTPWKTNHDFGGASLNIERKVGSGKLTSTTALRFWNWDPSNDRDFTGLPALSKSQNPSKHQQLSQEIRYAGDLTDKLSGVVGVYGISQNLKTDGTEESGAAQWRFSQSTTSPLWKTPGLFDGYGIKTNSTLKTISAAVFGQLDWKVTSKLHVLPGIRFNYDEKDVDFDRKTYGGLQTTDPALLALKRLVYTDQAFKANVSDRDYSGQLTLSYKISDKINTFATYARSFKPVGVNLGGLPTANGQILTDLAIIKPEQVSHYELGIKSSPTKSSTLNVTLYNTDVTDYQTQVQTAELGVNRGYLANAEKINVKGFEIDGGIKVIEHLSLRASLAYTDGKYVSFTNAPVPLEETGGASAFKDVSGGALPGISKWAGSLGAEYTKAVQFFRNKGDFFIAADSYLRSEFSSSPSPSQYLNIAGYGLLNGRFGFRTQEGLSISIWGRNILNKDYYEQLLPAAGNAGQYAAVVGDPATYGITIKYSL
jgi:iron complex outermembrane receptor protein